MAKTGLAKLTRMRLNYLTQVVSFTYATYFYKIPELFLYSYFQYDHGENIAQNVCECPPPKVVQYLWIQTHSSKTVYVCISILKIEESYFIEFWIFYYSSFNSLDWWILDDEIEELDTQLCRYKPESIEELEKTTKFSRQELKSIYRGFKHVRLRDKNHFLSI